MTDVSDRETDTHQAPRRGVRVRCPLGGYAPCLDDLRHGSDTTLCGLARGFDFCDHDVDPETCPECRDAEDEDWGWP